jgi:hypothetical protein
MDSLDRNRLLLEMDKTISDLNREIINPEIPELRIKDLQPVITLVAMARKEYLKTLFDIATECHSALPATHQVARLSELRKTFEELLAGAQAMETAIERGYLDISR